MSSRCRSALRYLWALPLACGFAAPAWAQDRIYAEPELSGGNPFQSTELTNAKLPVAARGFSVVVLRDHQQWVPGQPKFQLILDGQIYWFAGPRDLNIFAAAPHQYAPALGGDCVVTYLDTGERVLGKLELGLIHNDRIYFFAGERERELFQKNPAQYAHGDLANSGRCIVSLVDSGKSVEGLPETVATVGGLRYLFAGAYERRLFAADPAHYGVQRVLAQAPVEETQVAATPVDDQKASTKSATAPAAENLEEPEEQHYAMEGYCPVTIQEQGTWLRGSFQTHVDYEGKRYLLAGDKEKKKFMSDPKRYVPILGGDCIVSKVDDGKQEPGNIYHSLVFEGKLYLFVGADQVKSFKADPIKYVDPTAQPETPATPPQDEAAPVEDEAPVENVLREGRRSEFSGSSSRR